MKTMKYLDGLKKLAERVQNDRCEALVKAGNSTALVGCSYENTARKFDRILLITIDPAQSMEAEAEVALFVERETGNIYGPKTENAPNLKWWFGTLATMDQWDFSTKEPTPKKGAFVAAKKRYAEHTHWVPASEPYNPDGEPEEAEESESSEANPPLITAAAD